MKTIVISISCKETKYHEEKEFTKKLEIEDSTNLKNLLDCEVIQFVVWGFEEIYATIYDLSGKIMLDY